ncbi:hypothetical protein N7272_15245, partial [Enterococcus faecalis]|nr:hypothetical protein [Enterococcus faecalis]
LQSELYNDSDGGGTQADRRPFSHTSCTRGHVSGCQWCRCAGYGGVGTAGGRVGSGREAYRGQIRLPVDV